MEENHQPSDFVQLLNVVLFGGTFFQKPKILIAINVYVVTLSFHNHQSTHQIYSLSHWRLQHANFFSLIQNDKQNCIEKAVTISKIQKRLASHPSILNYIFIVVLPMHHLLLHMTNLFLFKKSNSSVIFF
jgi:hypothetical protein